jgi:hypothetical protein
VCAPRCNSDDGTSTVDLTLQSHTPGLHHWPPTVCVLMADGLPKQTMVQTQKRPKASCQACIHRCGVPLPWKTILPTHTTATHVKTHSLDLNLALHFHRPQPVQQQVHSS